MRAALWRSPILGSGAGSASPGLSGPELALVLSNILALAYMAAAGEDLSYLLFLYWAETAIIGFFSLVKMGVGGYAAFASNKGSPLAVLVTVPGILFMMGFFTVHFGGFMFGHLMALYAFFLKGAGLFELISAISVPLAFLFTSHALSFFSNFMGGGEYKRAESIKLAFIAPYGRVVVTHLMVFVVAFLSSLLPSEYGLASGLILGCVKIMGDLRSHRGEHRGSADIGAGFTDYLAASVIIVVLSVLAASGALLVASWFDQADFTGRPDAVIAAPSTGYSVPWGNIPEHCIMLEQSGRFFRIGEAKDLVVGDWMDLHGVGNQTCKPTLLRLNWVDEGRITYLNGTTEEFYTASFLIDNYYDSDVAFALSVGQDSYAFTGQYSKESIRVYDIRPNGLNHTVTVAAY